MYRVVCVHVEPSPPPVTGRSFGRAVSSGITRFSKRCYLCRVVVVVVVVELHTPPSPPSPPPLRQSGLKSVRPNRLGIVTYTRGNYQTGHVTDHDGTQTQNQIQRTAPPEERTDIKPHILDFKKYDLLVFTFPLHTLPPPPPPPPIHNLHPTPPHRHLRNQLDSSTLSHRDDKGERVQIQHYKEIVIFK